MRQGLDKYSYRNGTVIKHKKDDFRVPELRFPNFRIRDFEPQEYSRDGDEEGVRYWKEQLANGAGRNNIVYGFANSQEFVNLQNSYGIEVKETTPYLPIVKAEMPKNGELYWQLDSEKWRNSDGRINIETKYFYDDKQNYMGCEQYRSYLTYNSNNYANYLSGSAKIERYANGNRKSKKTISYEMTWSTEIYKGYESEIVYADNINNTVISSKEIYYRYPGTVERRKLTRTAIWSLARLRNMMKGAALLQLRKPRTPW